MKFRELLKQTWKDAGLSLDRFIFYIIGVAIGYIIGRGAGYL